MPEGIMVIAVFRPKPGKQNELNALTLEHVPILRRLGFATDRSALAMRARDGSVIEVFEWASSHAIEEAHGHPEVLEMWQRYEACCTYQTLSDLVEANELFAGYDPIDLP